MVKDSEISQVELCRDYLRRQSTLTKEANALRAKAKRYRSLGLPVSKAVLMDEILLCAYELEERARVLELSESATG